MGLKRVLFGSDRPTRHQVAVSVVITFVAVVGFYGMAFADFVPTDWWYSLGLKFAISLSIVFGIYVLYAQNIGGLPTKLRMSITKRRAAIPLVQLLTFPFYWTSICYGIPDLAAWSTGGHHSETALVTTSRDNYRKTRLVCPVKMQGNATENAVMGRLCVDSDTPVYSTSPVQVTLIGKATPLGFRVEEVVNFRPALD